MAHRTAFLLVLLLLGFFGHASAQQSPPAPVKLYLEANAAGPFQEIPVGTFGVESANITRPDGSKPVFSVSVSDGFGVKFCEEVSGAGKCEQFASGVHDLTLSHFSLIVVGQLKSVPAPAATASSQAPADPPVIVYEERNWLGRSQVFGPGMYRSSRGEFGKINDDMAMSIIVSKGFRAKFCVDEGIWSRGSGDCEEYTEGRYNLRFSNAISFIQVFDLADPNPADDSQPVILYEDGGQGGKLQGFGIGDFAASKGAFSKIGDNNASSVQVKKGFQAMICSDEPVGGGEPQNCEVYGPGKKDLKAKKAASFIRVTAVK